MTDIRLGQLITGKANKDAVHIAIAPVIAHRDLRPGEHVGVKNGTTHDVYEQVGIVDPFLKFNVKKGQKCYILLYQYSITDMRHEWTHPYFQEKETEASPSIAWLTHYASIFSMNYLDLIEACNNYLDNDDDYFLSDDTPDEAWSQNEEMWKHYEIVTGRIVKENQRNNFFRCAC